MANEIAARRYALAIFELAAEAHAVESVGRDLQTASDAIYAGAPVKAFFLSPVVDRKEKELALTAALSGKVNAIVLHAVLLLVRKRREALLREIVKQYAVLELRSHGLEPLQITSAKPLAAGGLRDLVARLEKIYAKKFAVTQRVDPELIGGVRIMMGDRRVDGSVAGRLEELARTLFAQN